MKKKLQLTEREFDQFEDYLRHDEREESTIEAYLRSLTRFAEWADGRTITKELAMEWKTALSESGYRPISLNAMLAAVNKFFTCMGREDCKVKYLKLQRQMFRKSEKDLSYQCQKIRPVLHNCLYLYFDRDFFLLRNCHLLFRLCKAENMARCKNTSVNNRYQKISCFLTAASQFSDQRYGNNVNDSDRDHRRHRTRSIDLRTFINILCHRSTEGSVRNIYTCVSQNQQTVCDHHINDLGCI